jgi:hypothetical protein
MDQTKRNLVIYLPLIRHIARKKKIEFKAIALSDKPDKKYMITLLNDKNIHFGAANMEDYIMHQDETRRKRFHDRFKSNKGYYNPESGLFYSARLLW